MLLEKLKPSIRLLVKKYIVFSESVIVVGEEGEEDKHRSLTLDLSVSEEGSTPNARRCRRHEPRT